MTDDLMLRLRNCYNFLEDEGHYVKANTVHLAIDRIEALEAKLAKAEVIVRIIASAEFDERIGEAVDLSCEYLAELEGDKP